MGIDSPVLPKRQRGNILGIVSFGCLLVIVGAIFITTPNLFSKITDFFRDLGASQVPRYAIRLPAPQHPRSHLPVYSAVAQFSLLWGISQSAILALRFAFHSRIGKKAETLSNTVYWFGSAYLVQQWLIETTRWFEYWALIIALLGFSLIIRAVFLALAQAYSRAS